MNDKLKRYLVLALFNFGLLVISFYIYSILANAEPGLSLVALAAPWFIFVLIYAFAYGIIACLYVKSLIFSQLLFFCFAFFIPFCFGTFDFVKFEVLEIAERLDYLKTVELFSLVPAIITKLVVKLIDYKKKKSANAE